MRWTGWFLAAIVVGYAGVAGGQPCCQECGGYSMGWGPLSGEACCSPPGLSLSAWRPSCCCGNQRPCCDNAWDGYCVHHARVQAFWAQVGVPKVRCYPMAVQRAPARAYTVYSEGAPPTAQPTPSPAATTPAPSERPSLAPVPEPSNAAPMPPAAPAPASPAARPAPADVPIPPPPSEAPKPSAAPGSTSSTSLKEAPMPPDEAFRGVSPLWLR